MPRVDHTALPVAIKGYPDPLPIAALSADRTMFASDATNFEKVNHAENLVLVAWNSGVTGRTVTITSASYQGRSGDITAYALAAGAHAIFGPFPNAGWRQSDGKLYFGASHLDVKWDLILV